MRIFRVVIFAKAPVAGLAKTRLIPALGPAGCAALARQLLHHTVEQAFEADIGPVELCVAPDAEEALWNELTLPGGLQWSNQGAGSLGERMARASQRVTGAGETILLIGTDCPALGAERLRAATQALHHHDACLIPVSDGGYALLGLNAHEPAVFNDMPWSTSSVAQLTERCLQAQGKTVAVLGTLHDIDEPEDLQWLPMSWQINDKICEE